MKNFLRIALAVLLAFLFVLPAGAADSADADQPALAPDGIVRPMFVAISSISAGLTINGSGQATCSGLVIPSNNTYTVYLTVALQQSNGDGTWSQVTSWSGSGVGYSGCSLTGYSYVNHGTYRVCSAAFVYSSGGTYLESALSYSATQVY